MRKRLLTSVSTTVPCEPGLDLEACAIVEVTSEDPEFCIESSLGSGDVRGWRASSPELKRFGCSLTNPNTLAISLWLSRKREHRAHKSSCCDGLPTPLDHSAISFGSNGISVHPQPLTRLKITAWRFLMLRYSN